MHAIDDLRIRSLAALTPPRRLIEALPRPDSVAQLVGNTRAAVHDILHGRDDRLIVVVGPCSIHDPEAALDYAARLARVRTRMSDDVAIVMRVYFEKPRTTIGWKGLINDPHLDNSFRIEDGLRLARRLLVDINAVGVPAGCEFLDVMIPQYVVDLVSWGAIGARTTESQVHRQLASGLSCPVGFKNATTGDVRVALDAMAAAAHPHHFLALTKDGQGAIAETMGNDDCHLILRGGSAPNYDAASVAAAGAAAAQLGLPARIMVDASHANSGKRPENQPHVIAAVCDQIAAGDRRLMGLMIESNLAAGRQELGTGAPLIYGQSVTDGCIDWATTEAALDEVALAVRQRRAALRARAPASRRAEPALSSLASVIARSESDEATQGSAHPWVASQ